MNTRRALAVASAVGRDLTNLTLTLGPPKVHLRHRLASSAAVVSLSMSLVLEPGLFTT